MPLLTLQQTQPQADEVPLLKTRVQRALIAILQAGPYYKVSYEDGVPHFVKATDTASPTSVRCNEINASFDLARGHGRQRVLKRSQWIFEALVQFSTEVTLEALEDALTSEPFGLASEGDKPAVLIDLKSVKYLHPTTSPNSLSGTGVRFTFVASPLRP